MTEKAKIRCFIDPIFLTTKKDFKKEKYFDEIFLKFCNFLDLIEELNNKDERVIKFNLNGYILDIILDFTQFDKFNYEYRFNQFLLSLIPYINRECEDINIYRPLNEPKIQYKNEYINNEIMEYWNSYLNLCKDCKICNKKKDFDLLTSENYGSKNKSDKHFEIFFSKKIINLNKWLKKKF